MQTSETRAMTAFDLSCLFFMPIHTLHHSCFIIMTNAQFFSSLYRLLCTALCMVVCFNVSGLAQMTPTTSTSSAAPRSVKTDMTITQKTVTAYRTIRPKEVRALLDTACHTVIIDVRSEQEFMSKTGHLDDARRIPNDSLMLRANELEEFKDRPILVYCRTGGRSTKAAETLTKLGFSQVYNLDGGISAWDRAGMIVIREKQADIPKK
jgi:rhodanese-related sulfurtransferase